MPGQHAKLAPSGSKRWLSCTASPLYVEALRGSGVIRPEETSIYAEEGLEAHDWAKALLTGRIAIDKVPESFRPHVMEYQRVCTEVEHGAGKGSIRMVEQKVPLFYSPEETGTVDFGFLRLHPKEGLSLHIRDLKYGAGVPVDAEENTQLAIYAMSWIVDLESWWGDIPDHIQVTIGIHQPRYAGDDSLKVWETTVGELREFCVHIDDVAKEIQFADSHENLTFAPSAEVCQFCPAKAVCAARAAHAFADFPVDVMDANLMSNLDLPNLDNIPVETLVSIWSRSKEITQWLDGAKEHLTALAVSGNPAPGTKLVAGRDGNRAWKDEEKAAKLLSKYLREEEIWKQMLISPSVAEKELKPHIEKVALGIHMVKLTERAAGKEVLALEEDKRPAVQASAEMLPVLTDETED